MDHPSNIFCSGDTTRKGFQFVQHPVRKALTHRFVKDSVQILDGDDLAGLFIDGARDTDLNPIVVSMTVAIGALSENSLVLGIFQRLGAQDVCGWKRVPARQDRSRLGLRDVHEQIRILVQPNPIEHRSRKRISQDPKNDLGEILRRRRRLFEVLGIAIQISMVEALHDLSVQDLLEICQIDHHARDPVRLAPQGDLEPVVVPMLPGCRAEPTAILLLRKVL